MEAFLYVLVVSFTEPHDTWLYQGHFANCKRAHLYMELNLGEVKASKCLLEEYIVLPKDTPKKFMDTHDAPE